MISKFITNFFRLESLSGILLIAATILALIAVNSPLKQYYDMFLNTQFSIAYGSFSLSKPMLLWINDGLMAIFFFLIGLELKREILDGELSSANRILFPIIGALGGMVVPAGIYAAMNWSDPIGIRAWAVPTATDIAFCLGILSLLGDRIPTALKVFLTTLAIFDDIGAIAIIAGFYTDHLSMAALGTAGVSLLVLLVLNRLHVTVLTLYAVVSAVLWTALLKSGVHATLAGVLAAFFIPMQDNARTRSPLIELEEDLHSVVSFVILPLFAFANTGIPFEAFSPAAIFAPVPLGIALGLFLGKQTGIFAFCWLGVKIRLCSLPAGMGWKELYGTAMLCGIGFTMSLFIGTLASEQGGPDFNQDRVGIIFGSLLSALGGYFYLRFVLARRRNKVLSRT